MDEDYKDLKPYARCDYSWFDVQEQVEKERARCVAWVKYIGNPGEVQKYWVDELFVDIIKHIESGEDPK